uniref:Uncharacterized protein n=1 Tax=Rodentolepis nana TaxID=102285 RepID=A0A0R3TEW2_RODNA
LADAFPHYDSLNQKRIQDLNNEGLNQERIPDQCNEIKARIPDLKVQRTQSSNNRETVDSGTLRHSRLAKNQKQWTVALFDIANEKQWTVALSRSEENSRSQGATNLNNKGEPVDSGTLRHRIAPLMSLDYVPNTIAYQNTFTDWEYTLNSHVHLHRLGVYTQPTWTFRLGYTLNPHALYVTYIYGEDPPDSVSSPKENDGKPEVLGSKKTANELLLIN